MLSLPFIFPKIKGFEIIEDEKVTEKRCNYHPIAIEWLGAVTDKFLFNKRFENDILILNIYANIKVTLEIDILLEIPF